MPDYYCMQFMAPCQCAENIMFLHFTLIHTIIIIPNLPCLLGSPFSGWRPTRGECRYLRTEIAAQRIFWESFPGIEIPRMRDKEEGAAKLKTAHEAFCSL